MNAGINQAVAMVVGPLFLDIVLGPLDSLPDPGQEKWVEGCAFVPGGSANQAIALAKLGMITQLRAYVGEDEAGKLTQRMLEAEGVSTDALVARERQSVTASMSVGTDRAMVTYGTDRAPRLAADDPPSLLMGDMTAINANASVVEAWRRSGVAPVVIADVGWDESGEWDLAELVALNLVDYFVPNDEEAVRYTRTEDVKDAARELQKLVPAVIITRGSRGVYAFDGQEEIDLPGIDVQSVDPTGAGDTFGAAFAWSIMQRFSFRQAVSTAAVAATISVLSLGGSSSAPTVSRLREWVREHPVPESYDLSPLTGERWH